MAASHGLALRMTFLLSLSAFCIIHGTNAECVSGGRDKSAMTLDGADFLPYDGNTSYQVILPGLQFHCYGVLEEWSALTVYKDFPTSNPVVHLAYFQVWRPNGTGRYVRVGYDQISIPRSVLNLAPITDAVPGNDRLRYFNLSSRVEDRSEDGQTSSSEDNKPLYFQPGDIVGFFFQPVGTNRPLYITHRNQTDSERVMDMFYKQITPVSPTNYVTDDQQCQMSECSGDVKIRSSIVPNIHFTYRELNETHEAFQNQPLSTENCLPHVDLELCPSPLTPSISPPSSSPSLSTSPSVTPSPSLSTSPSVTPSPTTFVTNPAAPEGMLLRVIAISAVGVLVILVVGGVFIVIVTLVCKKKTSVESDDGRRQATNTLYSEMNGVDDPTAYASTYQVTKTGVRHTYLEVERDLESTPHFALPTDQGSAMSLNSHHGRPPIPPNFVSGPVRGGAASMQRILVPGEGGAMSLQKHGGSLRGATSGVNSRPLVSSVSISQPPHSGNARRGSMPLRTRRESHQQLLPGKSMPLLSTSSVSPPPLPGPPTPEISDPPVPYLTPEKPWYKTDYEPTIPMKSVPEEEILYVPTMEERRGLRKEEVYSRLRRPHHSKHCNSEVVDAKEPDLYEEPASSTSEIYQQLSSRRAREIIREYITVQDHLGSGHFARVHRGIWRKPQGEQEVAVKELKCSAFEENKVKFLQEAVIMGQFNHTNVVKLHGVVTLDEPLMIVMELMPNGDLKNYLDRFNNNRSLRRLSSSFTPPPSPGTPLPITPSLPAQLLSFCRQVGQGMRYLASKNFVHRDLAARNIFLTNHFACKIGDFGLARDLGADDVYQSRGGKIPIKWTAPEALQYRQYTSASDVWSYGMVLYEIWSLGHRPFDGCSGERDVLELIADSVCQPPPPGCPREVYRLMTHCWHNDPNQRPTFYSVCQYLSYSESDLLKLPDDLPPSVPHQATQLGAPLAEAKDLYLDLRYCTDESVV